MLGLGSVAEDGNVEWFVNWSSEMAGGNRLDTENL